jgi:predicted chitinase/chitodextrinase
MLIDTPRLRSLVARAALALFIHAAACGVGHDGTREVATVDCSGHVGTWSPGTSYATGAVVQYHGKVYRCVQGHTALEGWAPDIVPALWDPARCQGGGNPPPTAPTPPPPTGGNGCNATTWQQGKSYNPGDIVRYPANGKLYKCTNANPGYDPTISTWFWDPTSCDGGNPPPVTPPPVTPPPPTGGNSCNATTWQQGKSYNPGDVVLYASNGNFYKCTNANPGYDPTISTWFWSPTICSGGGNPPPVTPPPPVTTPPPVTGGGGGDSGLASILSESTFDSMFPGRNSFYTYQGLVQATSSFGPFATSGDATARKREVAAFLANVAHETGGLVYIEEIAKADYCQPSPGCPCAPGKQYYGRGPIQISWNFNYCSAGAALGLPLQAQPELVANDAKVAWQTGLWFWMTQSGAGGQTPHNAILNGSFGETIRSINGSIECNGGNPGEMQDRVQLYQRFCNMLGVDPGASLTC